MSKQSSEAELYKGFVSKIPPKDRGFKLFLRRLSQTCQILFGSAFASPEEMQAAITKRYEIDSEIDFYERLARWGWHDYEEKNVASILEKIPSDGKVLVIGCGAGREVFALESSNPRLKVDGLDISAEMIKLAKKIAKEKGSQARFVLGSFRDSQPELEHAYDLVWVTGALEMHTQGKMNRVRFFQTMQKFLRKDGIVFFLPFIERAGKRKHLEWGSQLLRLRWFGKGRWEPGDRPSSFLGYHSASNHMIYTHSYPSDSAFEAEITEAGYSFSVMEQEGIKSWLGRAEKNG